MPNGRRTVVEFSLTFRAERQVRTVVEFLLTSLVERQKHSGRVLNHLSCRTAGAQWLSSHSPLVPTGSAPAAVYFHSSTSPWLGDLEDYMITTIGIQRRMLVPESECQSSRTQASP
ncbi:unnamed protein product [Prunus armeniaca]